MIMIINLILFFFCEIMICIKKVIFEIMNNELNLEKKSFVFFSWFYNFFEYRCMFWIFGKNCVKLKNVNVVLVIICMFW